MSPSSFYAYVNSTHPHIGAIENCPFFARIFKLNLGTLSVKKKVRNNEELAAPVNGKSYNSHSQEEQIKLT
jgi:hypothetical protein